MRCINISSSIFASVMLLASVHAHAAESSSDSNFFSDAWRQVTDMAAPAPGGDGTLRPADAQSISVKDGAVAVDASNVATQAILGSDDTVVLQAGDGSRAAPALVEAETQPIEPEKKTSASADKESSIWDDMVNAIGLGGDAPAATPEKKKEAF